MFKFRVIATFALVAVCCNVSSAGIIFDTTSRTVSAGSNSISNTTTGIFNQSVSSPGNQATASQNTDFTVNSLSGTGSVSRPTQNSDAAQSTLTVQFDLAEFHSFTLTSNLNASSPANGGMVLSTTTGSIVPDGSPIISAFGSYSTSGILGPGSYFFSIGTSLPGGGLPSIGSANYSFNFEVAAVPEPSSMILVAMGVIGLPIVRRKRR